MVFAHRRYGHPRLSSSWFRALVGFDVDGARVPSVCHEGMRRSDQSYDASASAGVFGLFCLSTVSTNTWRWKLNAHFQRGTCQGESQNLDLQKMMDVSQGALACDRCSAKPSQDAVSFLFNHSRRLSVKCAESLPGTLNQLISNNFP